MGADAKGELMIQSESVSLTPVIQGREVTCYVSVCSGFVFFLQYSAGSNYRLMTFALLLLKMSAK